MATFKFELVSPERLVLSTDAEQVDLPGAEGDLGILAGHSPFLSTLRPGVITVKAAGRSDRYFVRGGFADVAPNGGLTVLAERAVAVADLKADQIAAEIRNAEEDLAGAPTTAAKEKAAEHLQQLRDVADALKAA